MDISPYFTSRALGGGEGGREGRGGEGGEGEGGREGERGRREEYMYSDQLVILEEEKERVCEREERWKGERIGGMKGGEVGEEWEHILTRSVETVKM